MKVHRTAPHPAAGVSVAASSEALIGSGGTLIDSGTVDTATLGLNASVDGLDQSNVNKPQALTQMQTRHSKMPSTYHFMIHPPY